MVLPNRNINIIFNVMYTLHVDIYFYMNNFKINKGKKPAIIYYFSAYKVNETCRSNGLLCNLKK